MTISNCVQCGQVILTRMDTRCRACVQLHLDDTRKVKDYVRKNPRASLIEVYHNTGVSIRTIKELTGS